MWEDDGDGNGGVEEGEWQIEGASGGIGEMCEGGEVLGGEGEANA